MRLELTSGVLLVTRSTPLYQLSYDHGTRVQLILIYGLKFPAFKAPGREGKLLGRRGLSWFQCRPYRTGRPFSSLVAASWPLFFPNSSVVAIQNIVQCTGSRQLPKARFTRDTTASQSRTTVLVIRPSVLEVYSLRPPFHTSSLMSTDLRYFSWTTPSSLFCHPPSPSPATPDALDNVHVCDRLLQCQHPSLSHMTVFRLFPPFLGTRFSQSHLRSLVSPAFSFTPVIRCSTIVWTLLA